jgi:uncharacterized membrane protein YbjE (DUF340 family)
MKLLNVDQAKRQSEDGSAVAVVLAMLSIMMICLALNTVAMRTLDRELKLVEKHQVQRLQGQSQNPAQNQSQ